MTSIPPVGPNQPNTPLNQPVQPAAPKSANTELEASLDKARFGQPQRVPTELSLFVAQSISAEHRAVLAPEPQQVLAQRPPLAVTMYTASDVNQLKIDSRPPIQKTHFSITVPVQGDEV